MTKKARDPVKDLKEQAGYALFYVFIFFFLLNTVFGLLSGSKCLLILGIFALFGFFIAVVTLIRINRLDPLRRARVYFNPEKLEFIIVLGASLIIALSTAALFFSIGHMAFFHTLYPPEFPAAWVAMITAALSLGLMVWVKKITVDLPEIDMHEILFILNVDFSFSLVTMLTVVVSRMGVVLLDYACAIFAAFFLILYSVKFLLSSFKGLMDAACDEGTVASIEKIIRKIRSDAVLTELRVHQAGHVLEIIAIFTIKGQASMLEAGVSVQQIKDSFRKKFLKPHEFYAGILERR